MAPSKKRKIPPQSTTLHKFFSSGGEAQPKKGRAQQAGIPTTETKRQIDTSQDVIIIDDSDSDCDGSTTVRKPKRQASTSSSDVEFVENDDERSKVNDLPVEAGSSSRNIENVSFGRPSSLLCSSSTLPFSEGRSNEDSLFGVPSALLVPSRNDQPSPLFPSNTLLQGEAEERDTGAPEYPFSRSPLEVVLATSTRFDSTNCSDGNSSTTAAFHSNSMDISSNDDEEWGMGDDEMAFVNPGAEEEEEGLEEIEVDLGDVSKDTDVLSCPLCNQVLSGMQELEIQDHVNNCIDSLSTLSPKKPPLAAHLPTVSATSSFKPHLPLSAHQAALRSSPYIVTQNSTPNSNAFSVLMASHKENSAWKEATLVEDPKFRPTKNNGGRRKAPFYKVLQGMPIAVDAFRYGTIPGVNAYFLTHAHSDHYTNLSSNWKSGPIYCSQATANLIIHMLAVDPKWVHPLPMDVASSIPNTSGVRVTLIEANHCPGSCLFLFEGPQTTNAGDSAFKSPFVGSSRTFRYLHCGDFRASPAHVLHPAVKGKRMDHVYLDTTYLDPKYTFPPQPLVISACAELAKRIEAGEGPDGTGTQKTVDGFMGKSKGKQPEKKDRMLFVVGTYSIGKERIVRAIAEALKTKIYCDKRKAAILRCQSDPELHALLTSNPLDASVHLVPLGLITSDKLKLYVEKYKGFTKAVGFRPTGWSYVPPTGSEQSPSIPHIIARSQQRTFTYANLRPSRNSTPSLQLYGVPYSEHSSFFELTCFAMSLDWGKMIATVNVGSESSRGKMARWVEKWDAERRKRGKQIVIPYREADYW